jgi:hypothetical protein
LTPVLPSTSALHPTALGCDTETFQFGRAMMAPPIVCAQWGAVDGAHAVEITRRCRDAIAWWFSREHEQLWFHNGPYDCACVLEWYPELSALVWGALDDGRVFDTMYLQRMVQVARGDIGGPLALDMVTQLYGVPPPTKKITAVHPDTGVEYDVRTSFGLWYMAEEIPEPWYGYADYDGISTIKLAERMVRKHCTAAPGKTPLVRLQDLAWLCRREFSHNLIRCYGLRVNPAAVGDLRKVAVSALGRLHEAATSNGFLKPGIAKRGAPNTGVAVCPVQYEPPPTTPAAHRRAAKHANCPGCKFQAIDTRTGGPAWKKNTSALKRAVTEAYEGNPPRTEAKKDKKTGKMRGGGQIATARHVLQDSHNEELMSWAEYNEWNALMSKDMKIFERGLVHSSFGIANTMRPTNYDPNTLNFRRTSFYIGECAACGYEITIDPRDLKKGKKTVLPCPHCEKAPPQ